MSAFEVEIQVEVDLPLPGAAMRRQLERAVATVLQAEEVAPPAALTILLTSAERVRGLNRTYRKIDKATDVLSFGADDDVPGMDAYLGDVAIALPVAQAQAEAGGHDLLDELTLLSVHGVLHLLGYDHVEPDEKEAMWARQDRVLAELGSGVRSPAYD